MVMSENRAYYELAKQIAQEAEAIMIHYFNAQNTVTLKPNKTIVSEADLEINEMVIRSVKNVYPKHDVYGEEGQVLSNSSHLWICDPIDGTNPFVRGIPLSVFSLALFINREPTVAVIHYPFLKKMYWAIKNEGAFMNEKQIHVSKTSKLEKQSIVNHEWWPDAQYDVAKVAHSIAEATGAYNLSLGSIAHSACLVASGKYEVSLFAGSKGQIVDIAAAKLLVEEAGGKVTDVYGSQDNVSQNDIKGCVMTNGLLHEEVMKFFP
jgi:myo-inositol-1(or 4)-monophosphatase